MARPTAPLFAFGARGQLGKSIVFSSWKGRDYVRQYLIPGNPRSSSQTETRSLFRWLQEVYKNFPSPGLAPWEAFAKGKPLTGRNAFTKGNLGPMRSALDLNFFIFSGGAGGGLVPEDVVATAGAGQISIAYTVPNLPAGWTQLAVVAGAIADQNPQLDTDYTSRIAFDGTSTTPIVIPFLTAGALYRGGIWNEQTKPDGSIAYSPSVTFSATPT